MSRSAPPAGRTERGGPSSPLPVASASSLPRRPYVESVASRRKLVRLLRELTAERGPGARPPTTPPGDGVGADGTTPEARPGTRILRMLTAAAWFALLVGVLGILGCGRAPPEAPDAPVEAPRAPLPPPSTTVSDTLRRGETLAALLDGHGIRPAEVSYLAELLRPYADARSLRPGTVVRLVSREEEPPHRIDLVLDADRTVALSTVGARWTARLDSVPVTRDTVLVGGRVRSNLYTAELFGAAAALEPRDHAELVHRLSRIFGWEIDFWRDVRDGDVYRAALERSLRPDGSLRSFRVLAAEYRGTARTHTAIGFQPPEGRRAFFDPAGRSLRGAFLQAPLDFVRVTSRFARRRYHPILGRARAHLGVDYGAPTGTPVRATGAGVVTRAGWWGGYGRIVEVRHPEGIRTRYAHLSAIGRGVRPGVRVEGGQVIGRVGSTGLSTAPHLHYEFLKDGRHLDPRRAPIPRAEPVADGERPRFEGVRDGALLLLAELRAPPVAVLTASETRPGAVSGLDD